MSDQNLVIHEKPYIISYMLELSLNTEKSVKTPIGSSSHPCLHMAQSVVIF